MTLSATGYSVLSRVIAGIATAFWCHGALAVSAYDQFLERPAWFTESDAGRASSGPPVSVNLSGWGGYSPSNSPEPIKPSPPPAAETQVIVARSLTLNGAGISDGGAIPVTFTCEGEDASPAFSWVLGTQVIAETALQETDIAAKDVKSYLLTMSDSAGTVHWLVYNVLPSVSGIPQGLPGSTFFRGFYQGINDFNIVGYSGPCPTNSDPGTYHFNLSALNTQLSFADPAAVTLADISTAVMGNVLFADDLTGTYTRGSGGGAIDQLELLSNDIPKNGTIPAQFSCDGNGVSPSLSWANPPADVVSYTLLVKDKDADDLIHWAAYNIRSTRTGINRGIPLGLQPGEDGAEFFQAKNEVDGELGYAAPCPPAFDGNHRYSFELFALDTELSFDQPALATAADVEEAMEGHVLKAATPLTAVYERQEGGGTSTFKLISPDFVDGGPLPVSTKSDFDIFVDGTQCFDPAMDVDREQTVDDRDLERRNTCTGEEEGDPDTCCATNADDDNDAGSICACRDDSQDDAEQNIGFCVIDDLVYTCPDQASTCALTARIPIVLVDGVLSAAASGQSPALEWSNVPPGTVELVLLTSDADIIGTGTSDMNTNLSAHWVAYGISPTLSSLDANQPRNFLVNGYFNAFNDIWWSDTARTANKPLGDGVLDVREDVGFWGACRDDRRIVFTLLALSEQLNFDGVEEVTYQHVVNAMGGKIIGAAQISGRVPAD